MKTMTDNQFDQGTTERNTRLLALVTKFTAFLFGVAFTYVIYISLYGNLAFSQFLKGISSISIQNMINMIENMNFIELMIWLYFILLFGTIFIINKFLTITFASIKKRQISGSPSWSFFHKLQQIIFTGINSFREGSLIIPLFVTIGSSVLVQFLLPYCIYFIVLVLIVLPFAILGEIYNFSKENLKHFVVIVKESPKMTKKEYSSLVVPLISVLCSFPLAVFVLIETNLDRFLNLVHYNLLWENPNSPIALLIWDIINQTFKIVFLNNDFLITLYNGTKYYLMTFIILILISQLYLYFKSIFKDRSIKLIEKYFLIYG